MSSWQQVILISTLISFAISTSVQEKKKICESDYKHSAWTLNLIEVSKETSTYPKVLCFINTISTHHASHVKAIRETWGLKCDKLVFCSNVTDESIGAVKIDIPISDHDHLWDKHRKSLEYIYDTYRDDYDWFYKADDDAFVIMENLKLFLRSPEIMMKSKTEPVQFGHRFNLTSKLVDYYIVDPILRQKFIQTFDRWVFNSGGPGYAMNRLYLETFLENYNSFECLNDKYSSMLPDDAAIAFCMAWHGSLPLNTRDLKGRERFHADQPSGVYFTNPNQPDYWVVQYHNDIGGLQWKEQCCSNESIAFHYITPTHMYHIARWLYYCPSSIVDLQQFNQLHHMRLPNTIFQDPPKPKN